jgi:hypothetical protein
VTKPTPKPSSTRMYIVSEADKPIALVTASNAAAALRHVVQPKFTVEYAEQADIIAACKAGIEPETASGEDPA